MNDFIKQYTSIFEQRWRAMGFFSKCTAVLICGILLFSGLVTGLFIFSASLAIALAMYLHSLFCRDFKRVV